MPEWSNELKNRATSMSIQWEPMTWPHTWVTWGTCLAQRPDSIYSRSITRKFEHLRNSGRKTIIQLSGSSETCPMKKRLKELTLFSQDVRKWRKSSRRLDGKILRESWIDVLVSERPSCQHLAVFSLCSESLHHYATLRVLWLS